MSGLRHPDLVEAYRLMHLRGITTDALAAAVKTSRTFVSRVLCNYERHGATWERIKAELMERECVDVVALLERVPVRQRSATHFRRAVRNTLSGFPASRDASPGSADKAAATPALAARRHVGRGVRADAGSSIFETAPPRRGPTLSEVAARFCNWRQQRSA